MKNFFDIVAPLYEKMHFGAQKTFHKLESLVAFESSDVVIDLGGGTGRIAKFLVSKVKKITVVDSSEGMIEQCRMRNPAIACVRADTNNLPCADESAQKVIIVDAFHHFQDQQRAVQEIKRVLSYHGTVIVAEFNPSTIVGVLVIMMERLFFMGSRFFTPLSLADVFSSHGFTVRLIDEQKASYYLVGEKM